MKIMYLTWGETPRSYGVFGTQAIRQFVETKKLLPEAEFAFVSGVPVVHSGLIREKLAYFNELKKIKENLNGITFSWISIWCPQNFAQPTRRTFNWLFFGAMSKLLKKIKNFNPDIIHCRSYGATWAALQMRNKNKLNFKIIFDARGLMPEELALKRNYTENNEDYKYFKNIENFLLIDSDLTIAVSDTMAEHFKALGAHDTEIIYLSADYNKISLQSSNLKDKKGSPRFIYVGALSESTWHKPDVLSDLFFKLKKSFPDSKLIIVSTSNHEEIRSYFKDFNGDDIILARTYSVKDLAKYLMGADFGLMSYFRPVNFQELKLANMVMAVKTAEYLCAGLPLIINKHCGGAAKIVERYDLGLVYDPDNLELLNVEKILQFIFDVNSRGRISTVAKSLFDYKVNAKKYADIYRNLI